jgi:hypothetical protein
MSPVMFPLAAEERDREKALRAQFIQFWSTATGDPRTVYDASFPQRRSPKASLASRSKPPPCAAGGCDRRWPNAMA